MDPPWMWMLLLALALLATSLLAAPQMNDFLGQDDQDAGTDDMERAAMDNLNVGQMPSGQGWGKGQGVPNNPQYAIVNGKKVQVQGSKRQGGNKGGQSGGRNKSGKGKGDKGKEAEDFTEQSKQAMLQLGVLVRVRSYYYVTKPCDIGRMTV